MSKVDFGTAGILLVDPDLNTRQSIKNILYYNGFRDLRFGKTLNDIRGVLTGYTPDLLISSCELHDGDFIDFIKEIRHGDVGANPFIPIITLIETPTPELVRRVVESGTDTVIAKPISTSQLLDRIKSLIESREKFVVLENYIGPARGKDQGGGGIEVPNTLRAKAVGEKLSAAEVEAMIDKAMGEIKTANLDIVGIQITAHIANLEPMLQRAERLDPSVRQELLDLLNTTDAADEKLAGSKYEHVRELCAFVGKVVRAILAAGDDTPDVKDVKLLKPLAQAIQACFSGAITTAAQVATIVRQIGAR